MKTITLITFLTCVCFKGQTQVNFVRNPSLERFDTCPNTINRINWCKYWSIPGDSVSTLEYCLEYFNICGNGSPDHTAHVPNNSYFYQFPRTGNGMAGGILYYDKTFPPPAGFGFIPFNYRDNLLGRLYKPLPAGKVFCVTFWVNLTETSGYAHNKIGAYLGSNDINNKIDTLGQEISSVTPQVFTNEIIEDTSSWTRIEGSFTATGVENYIMIGNFFPNDSITTVVMTGPLDQYSYYLFDDISVIPIDLEADAGRDSHAEPGKPVQIGRVGDTTAQGLDCKWYHKGTLIDSGAIISVNGSAMVGTVDTYVVVQTICGLSKTDTVTVKTVPLGMKEWDANQSFTVYPNPSNGAFTITATAVIPTKEESLHAAVYDVLGRIIHQQTVTFSNNQASVNIHTGSGMYILELSDEAGSTTHQRIIIE